MFMLFSLVPPISGVSRCRLMHKTWHMFAFIFSFKTSSAVAKSNCVIVYSLHSSIVTYSEPGKTLTPVYLSFCSGYTDCSVHLFASVCVCVCVCARAHTYTV